MNAFFRALKIEQWFTYRFLRWLFRAIFNWRTARRMMLAIATIATLIAVAYAVENWRGRRAWQQFKREVEAQGEHLDIAAFIPAAVPDDQNFAMTPLWRETFGGDQRSIPFPPLFSVFPSYHKTRFPRRGDWLKGERMDLAEWQRFYRDLHTEAAANAGKTPELEAFPIPVEAGMPAEDVLIALSRYDEKLKELRAAARRPASRFPLRYEDGWNMGLNHLSTMQSATVFLTLRSLAELELGRTDAAFADVELQFRLIASIETEPTLVSHLVRISMCPMVLEAIWHGAADHRWTEGELIAVDEQLRSLDWLSDYDLCCQSERAFTLQILDEMRTTRNSKLFETVGAWDGTGRRREKEMWAKLYRWIPIGWFKQNTISYLNATRRLGSPRTDASAGYVDVEDWRQRCERLTTETAKLKPYTFLLAPLTSWQSEASLRFIRTEALVRLARTACALERHRLAHGSYPESLDSLAPQFIDAVPRDVINGGELKYRRTDGDHFVLYSIGWNGKDDGGEVRLWGGRSAPPENRGIDPKEGDWVWKYPAE